MFSQNPSWALSFIIYLFYFVLVSKVSFRYFQDCLALIGGPPDVALGKPKCLYLFLWRTYVLSVSTGVSLVVPQLVLGLDSVELDLASRPENEVIPDFSLL